MSHLLQQTKIAKRYVNSLFASLTKKTDSTAVTKDIRDLAAMVQSSDDLKLFLESPLLTVTQHKAGIEKLATKAKFSTPVKNLLMIMAENRRLSLVPTLAYEMENYLAKLSDTLPVKIATARKLAAADQKKIGDTIKKATGKDVALETYVDETLIGGVVIQVESTLIDGSIKTKLDKIERELTGAKAA